MKILFICSSLIVACFFMGCCSTYKQKSGDKVVFKDSSNKTVYFIDGKKYIDSSNSINIDDGHRKRIDSFSKSHRSKFGNAEGR